MALTQDQLAQIDGGLQLIEGLLPLSAEVKAVLNDLIVDSPQAFALFLGIKSAAAGLAGGQLTAVALVTALQPLLLPLATLVDQAIAQAKALKAIPAPAPVPQPTPIPAPQPAPAPAVKVVPAPGK